MPRPSVGPTKPPVHCVPPFFPGTRRPGREVDLSPPSAEVQNDWSSTTSPLMMPLCHGQRHLCLYFSSVRPACLMFRFALELQPFCLSSRMLFVWLRFQVRCDVRYCINTRAVWRHCVGWHAEGSCVKVACGDNSSSASKIKARFSGYADTISLLFQIFVCTYAINFSSR